MGKYMLKPKLKWEGGASLHEHQELLFQQDQCDWNLSALGVFTLPWELILEVLGRLRDSSINQSATASVGKQWLFYMPWRVSAKRIMFYTDLQIFP